MWLLKRLLNAIYLCVLSVEKWKYRLDKKAYYGEILMDLSKLFDTINHDLFIAIAFSMASYMASIKTLVH